MLLETGVPVANTTPLPPVIDLVDVPAFQQHIAGLLCIAGGEARHVAHFGVEEQVFIAVRLVYKEAVHAKLLKGHNAVLPGGGVELFQAYSQGLFHPLQLLDGVPLRTAGLQLRDAVLNLRDRSFTFSTAVFPAVTVTGCTCLSRTNPFGALVSLT